MLYVAELIGPDVISTMPDQTLQAFADHGTVARTVNADPDEMADKPHPAGHCSNGATFALPHPRAGLPAHRCMPPVTGQPARRRVTCIRHRSGPSSR